MEYITVEEAQKRIYENTVTQTVVEKKIEECLGAVLANDAFSAISQPPFPRSAMDGYAVRMSDVEKASGEQPARLPVYAECDAGDPQLSSFPEGNAVRIMTGAPVPVGADTIIRQEDTDYGEETVSIYAAGKPQQYIVPIGEDFVAGTTLAHKGNRVDPYTIATLKAAGITKISVYRKIRVGILTTGSELVESGTLKSGEIYNSNIAYFGSRLQELGCEIVTAESVADKPQEIQNKMEEILPVVDFLVTTGGVSVGKKDYMPQVLENLHAKPHVQGISIKPGSPTMASLWEQKMILSLSGNPYSAIAMFEILFPYFEQKASGKAKNRLIPMESVAIGQFSKASVHRRFLRGTWTPQGVQIQNGQRNGQLYAGIGSNCLIDIPAGSPAIQNGDVVKIWLL